MCGLMKPYEVVYINVYLDRFVMICVVFTLCLPLIDVNNALLALREAALAAEEGDNYDGGNPWILLTASASTLLYRQAKAMKDGATVSSEVRVFKGGELGQNRSCYGDGHPTIDGFRGLTILTWVFIAWQGFDPWTHSQSMENATTVGPLSLQIID